MGFTCDAIGDLCREEDPIILEDHGPIEDEDDVPGFEDVWAEEVAELDEAVDVLFELLDAKLDDPCYEDDCEEEILSAITCYRLRMLEFCEALQSSLDAFIEARENAA